MLALRFTQNFLKDPQLVSKLVEQTDITLGDTVLEIGPGKGIITSVLASTVGAQGRVVAVELDQKLHHNLQENFQTLPQVELFLADILAFPLKSLGQNYSIFSNVPFAITAPLLEKLFQPLNGPENAWLILQTDTLQDYSQGKPRPTFKSLLLEPLYEITNLYDFSRSDFSPQPQADTALFFLQRRAQPLFPATHYALYQDFLAFISRDRVGEGAWKKLLNKRQLEQIARKSKLLLSKGLKSQSSSSLLDTFIELEKTHAESLQTVRGALRRLRSEQAQQAKITELGGHHRSSTRK